MLFIDLFLLILLLRSLFNCIFAIGFLKWIEGQQQAAVSSPDRLIIILPVYKEERSIDAALVRLSELLDVAGNCAAIVVGSSRERSGVDPRNLTLSLAEKAKVERDLSVTIVEDPDQNSNRAKQINYALATIDGSPAKSWILTLDIDSKVPRRVIHLIRSGMAQDAGIMHVPALFLDNFSKLSVLQKGQALYQSRWTITHECRRMLLHRWTGQMHYHLVGHGLCIELQQLLSVGMFPAASILEDVHLGYICSVLNRKVHIVPEFELADSPVTYIEGWRQQYRWAAGVQQYLYFLGQLRGRLADYPFLIRFKAVFFALQGMLNSISWNTSAYLLVAITVSALLGGTLPALYLLCYFGEFAICLCYFWRRDLIDSWDFFFSPFYLIFELLKRSVPANFAALSSIIGIKHRLKKAEH
ncbi:glycosyltransferase family 2 protein [Bradyrhizobium sp. UNPF46]|uniref:glycosyltransferase n=1 Tax=Bradyrhizobium sp. UNPF46 TaxID=1141168 RepID=UPI0015F0B945|nr:glycosyltransferase family 2 protein [Bradyrhizobium sp. UNPF46]